MENGHMFLVKYQREGWHPVLTAYAVARANRDEALGLLEAGVADADVRIKYARELSAEEVTKLRASIYWHSEPSSTEFVDRG